MTLKGFETAGTPSRSEHTLCLSLDAAIFARRTTSSLSAVQATGAQTAWSAQEERGPPAAAGVPVLKAWKETEAAPAKKALVEQPVKPVLMTTCLDPAVHKCATVCMACATVDSTVMALVSASLHTLAPAATSPSLNVQPCSAQKIPDAHLPVKTKQNWNANAFPITKAMAKSASPSTPVCRTSATLMLIAHTWDQIGTAAPAKNSTMGMATCAYQQTPARLTSETALRSPRCANTMGRDSLTVSVRNITTILYQELGAV